MRAKTRSFVTEGRVSSASPSVTTPCPLRLRHSTMWKVQQSSDTKSEALTIFVQYCKQRANYDVYSAIVEQPGEFMSISVDLLSFLKLTSHVMLLTGQISHGLNAKLFFVWDLPSTELD